LGAVTWPRNAARAPPSLYTSHSIAFADLLAVDFLAFTSPYVATVARKRKAMDVSRGFHLFRDGDAWCAVGPDFVDLQRSPAGFGATQQEAVRALWVELRKAGWPDWLPALSDFAVHGQ
jgi:hypothetical protein